MNETKEPSPENVYCPKCGSRKIGLRIVREHSRLILKAKCFSCNFKFDLDEKKSIPFIVYGSDACYCGRKLNPKKKYPIFQTVTQDEIVRFQFCSTKCMNAFVKAFKSKSNKPLAKLLNSKTEG